LILPVGRLFDPAAHAELVNFEYATSLSAVVIATSIVLSGIWLIPLMGPVAIFIPRVNLYAVELITVAPKIVVFGREL
jgi:hypothetical protein